MALLSLAQTTNVVIVDVRESAEREVSMIPGAISKEDFEHDLAVYRRRPIVTYCTIGYRSGLYASALRRQGLRARNLGGSILAWVHAGQPLTAGTNATHRLHVYGQKWDLAPAGYETVRFPGK